MHGLRNTLMANVSTSKIPVCGWMVKCVQKLMVLDGSHTGPGTASRIRWFGVLVLREDMGKRILSLMEGQMIDVLGIRSASCHTALSRPSPA